MKNQNLENLEILALAKIIDISSLNLKLNTFTPNFYYINSFLKFLDFKFQTYTPQRNVSPFEDILETHEIEEEIKKLYPKELNLMFDFNVDFSHLYILVRLCSNYGLKNVYYSNQTGNSFHIGLYEKTRVNHMLSKTIDIQKILEYPIYFTLSEFLKDYYNIKDYSLNNYLNRDLEEELSIEKFNTNSNLDYEEDSFNAFTDGQMGDYEDWKENGGTLDDF